jgi:hypothetical protein
MRPIGQSHYLSILRMLNLQMPTLAQHRACIFLERHGFKFCVDFGIENAVQKAREFRQ